MKKASEKNTEDKYFAHIGGPILFTAPHSKNLYRRTGNSIQVHERERHTSFLAVDFAHQITNYINSKHQTGSFCVWGKSLELDHTDLDPNYLLESLYDESPFHQSFHEFQAGNKETPLFHIDIHGKADRQHNCEMDIGILSMIVLWQKDEMAKRIQQYIKPNFNRLFQGIKLGQFQLKANANPALSGYWGSSVATMTTQAIELGIPSVQLELPAKLRDLLAQDKELRTGFVKILAGTYNNVIVPLWSKKIFPLKLNKKLLGKLKLSKFTKQQVAKLREELENVQKSITQSKEKAKQSS